MNTRMTHDEQTNDLTFCVSAPTPRFGGGEVGLGGLFRSALNSIFGTEPQLPETLTVTTKQSRHAEKLGRFLPVVRAFAAMSKYPGTKVGAVILGPDYEVRSSGWNGAPRGSSADEDHRLADRGTKLMWSAHAEANAIAQAARTGTPLKGCSIVVTHIPCSSCAKLIIQAGIVTVGCPMPDAAFMDRWHDDLLVTNEMFAECGVNLVIIGD